MSGASYNNGMYTPWSPPAASSSSAAAPAWSASTTSEAWSSSQQWLPSTTAAWSSSSSQQWWTPSSSSSSSSWQSATSSSAWQQPSSSARTSSTSMTPARESTLYLTVTSEYSSSTSPTLPVTIVRPSLVSDTSNAPSKANFKIIYLLPLFVLLPLALLVLGLLWYNRRRRRGGSSSGGSLFSDLSPVNHFEKEDLVDKEQRYVNEDQYPHPYAVPGGTVNWLPRSIRHAFGATDDRHDSGSRGMVPSVSYDQPFVPPSPERQYLATSSDDHHYHDRDEHGDQERGWTWGTNRAPTRQQSKAKSLLRVNSGLTSGFKWAQRRYRAKAARPDEDSTYAYPSPSAYSPTVDMHGTGNIYAGVADDEVTNDDLDAFLGESRVGHSAQANRWILGRPLPEDVPPPSLARPYVPVPANMPSAPIMSHASPTKRVHDTARNADTPTRSDAVVFSYESPVRTQQQQQRTARPALPTPPVFPSFVPPPRSDVGSPMPAFNAHHDNDTSAYDLAGVQDLIFGSSTVAQPPVRNEPVKRQLRPVSQHHQSSRPSSQYEDASPDALAQQYRDKRRSLARVGHSALADNNDEMTFADPRPLEPLAPSRVQHAIQSLEGRHAVVSSEGPKRYTRPALMEDASRSSPSRTTERPRSSSASSSRSTSSIVDPTRPLSSDPSRLSAMLRSRRSSSGPSLVDLTAQSDDKSADSHETASTSDSKNDGGLAAMLRRSTAGFL